jgi:hypothetical protein
LKNSKNTPPLLLLHVRQVHDRIDVRQDPLIQARNNNALEIQPLCLGMVMRVTFPLRDDLIALLVSSI